MRLFLCLVLCAFVYPLWAQNTSVPVSCAVDTFLDPTSNSCVCNSDVSEDLPTNVIYIAGILDLTNFELARDLFKVTVDLINEGFWPDVKEENQVVRFDLANSECTPINAVRSYWDLRTSNNGTAMHGIIGARCSGASSNLARLSGLERVPQISHASTSAALSNKDEFPYFSRLVSPDNELGEVGAIIATLRHFGWERVTILATDTLYAKDLVNEFRKGWVGPHDDASGSWFGNIAYSDTVRLLPNDQVDPDSIQQALIGVPTDEPAVNSRIILLVAHSQHAYKILEQATSQNFQPDTIWVGPSAWESQALPGSDYGWIPSPAGYLWVTPRSNRDQVYQDFLKELQDYQQQNDKEITTVLPVFGAEMVDAIRAMIMAISANTPEFSDGDAVVKNVRGLSFDGVSGSVEFTEKGDRKNPQFTIFNTHRATSDGPDWVEIGTVSADVGSANVADMGTVCFAQIGCGLEKPPSDRYPEPPEKLPTWAIALIVIIPLLLVGVAFKYWLSAKILEHEVEAFRKSLGGMRAAERDYIPNIGKAGDIEHALSGSVVVAPNSATQWCWQETLGMMHKHRSDEIYDDQDCWIKYDQTCNSKIEEAFQAGYTECSPLPEYKVDLINKIQTKLETGFQRKVQRVVENNVVQGDNGEPKQIDLGKVQLGMTLPDDLDGEPQMVLVAGDIVQISTERKDGWAFGSKLHHADEVAARQLVIIATGADSGEIDDDANVFVDTGWFPKEVTHIPSREELAALQKKIRPDGLDPPLYWDANSDPSAVSKHEITVGHKEYSLVVDAFMSTLNKDATVVKVERIQNLAMYKSYIVKLQTICDRETNGNKDEKVQRIARERFERKWLWHGCPHSVVDKILQQGFNKAFCGKNATAFGRGYVLRDVLLENGLTWSTPTSVYFARDASYSANPLYSALNSVGNQHVMACRVVVGEYCHGKHDALTPDIRDPASQLLYDSTVGLASDPLPNPSIYVTYHDAQAYPEYLITFNSVATA